MKNDASPAWRATGLIWTGRRALLEWSAPDGGSRQSPLDCGAHLALAAGADRRCVGVWRAGRRNPCPIAAPIVPAALNAQCPDCAAVDRSHSIAADTRLDDPRMFAVYLAHHGDAGIKVGITAVDRGLSRLLEQGALASLFLSTGTLPSARRTEHLLGVAAAIPDRITTGRKRAARARPGGAEQRAADLLAAVDRTRDLAWPEGQTRREPQPSDHAATYGLPPQGLRPTAAILPLAPGLVLRGRVACRIGADVYLDTDDARVVLNIRLLAGWALHRPAPETAPFTAALQPIAPGADQDALF